VAEGANGIANGRGVRSWTERDGQALIAARMEELFRWLKAEPRAQGLARRAPWNSAGGYSILDVEAPAQRVELGLGQRHLYAAAGGDVVEALAHAWRRLPSPQGRDDRVAFADIDLGQA
jgi:hypothetical protein